MKKILVLYYSQTGQLTEIVNSVTTELKNDREVELTFEKIQPKDPYPFPWTGKQFFQAFPESVKEIPCELNPITCETNTRFDLVILAYQIWFLSPSIPISSFLKTDEAKKIFNGCPILTIIGCRNMWVMAHERIKEQISKLGGRLVGNIVLIDRAPNLISVVTIIRWLVNGRREGKGVFKKLFPRAGVSQKDVTDSRKYGRDILNALKDGEFNELQKRLVEKKAVEIKPVLVSIEKRGYMMFKIWAKLVLRKGTYNDPNRATLLVFFKYYLFAVIFLVSPLASVIFYLIHLINREKTRKSIRYYSGINE
jgi:hypothetical protein